MVMLAWLWRPMLVLAVAGALGWWMLSLPSSSRTPPTATAPVAIEPAAPPPAPRKWQPRPRVEPAPGCAPQAERRCVDGDAWWVDGCGVVYEVAQDCGRQLCRDGECEPPPPPNCGGEPILGRCDGQVARGCEGGYPFAVDCAALGRRCVKTEEGPVCRPTSEDDCDPALERPRCTDEDTLVVCHEGQRQRTDCRAYGAVCGTPPGRSAPTCVQRSRPVLLPGCDDACGCPPVERGEEVCDGKDNDDDGWIDESGQCEPVDLVVYVVLDDDGNTPYEPEDIDDEVATLQRLFARQDDYGLSFRLAEVVRLAEPGWLELDDSELGRLIATVRSAREDFYVPVVLTERVIIDGVPRPGASTVPNGECGGQRRVMGRQPPLGVIALAKHRWPTTFAHELGHFLGLCHTHGDQPGPVVAVDDSQGATCTEACGFEGDGLCDTPPDPGPDQCAIDPACGPVCDDGSRPDPSNLMGYYPDCRGSFTEQQALLMRQTVARRRAWAPCAYGDGCACEPVGSATGSTTAGQGCPEGMSCRRFRRDSESFWRCELDGPAVVGGVCTSSLECSATAQCIGQPDAPSRCVRPCSAATPGCQCLEVDGVDHPICIDDLRREDG
ncbi:MAG: M43 family zinc metalloprotease [Nannocystaceae bacterium]